MHSSHIRRGPWDHGPTGPINPALVTILIIVPQNVHSLLMLNNTQYPLAAQHLIFVNFRHRNSLLTGFKKQLQVLNFFVLLFCYSCSSNTFFKSVLFIYFSYVIHFVFRRDAMVQMGVKTTTITKADMLIKQEMNLLKNDQHEEVKKTRNDEPQLSANRQEIIWTNVIFITLIHILAVTSFFCFMTTTQTKTIVWGEFNA